MRTFDCRGGGTTMSGRPGRAFCSNACQGVYGQRLLLERWLATGEGRPDTGRAHYIRRFLLAEQLGRCAVCSNGTNWQGLPLTFVLDHIDGDANNNERGNLRLVCPNCDSQLPTYKNRNAGRGRHWRRERYANGQSY